MYKNNKKMYQVKCELKEIDYLAFTQFYYPLIGDKAAFLYNILWNRKKVLNIFKIEVESLENLFKLANLNENEFAEIRNKLETVFLLKTTISQNLNGEVHYYFYLKAPLSLKECLENATLVKMYDKSEIIDENRISETKKILSISENFDNLKLENNDVFDLTMNLKKESALDKSELELSNETRTKFYGALHASSTKSIFVSEEVYNLIFHYYEVEKLIDLDKLILIGYKSIISSGKSYKVCAKNFETLIDYELKKDSTKNLSTEMFENFWRKEIFNDFSLVVKKAEKLFSVANEKLYLILTNSRKVPPGIISLISNLTKEGFQIITINVVLSFTNTWINKIPKKYLEKTFETLYNKNNVNLAEVLKHLLDVIKKNIDEGDNKLKIKLPKIEVTLKSTENLLEESNESETNSDYQFSSYEELNFNDEKIKKI